MQQQARIDTEGTRKAVRDLLEALGFDPTDDAIEQTPDRVQRAYSELLGGYKLKPEDILDRRFRAEGEPQIIAAADIPFNSLCEHHLLPFTGKAHVAYVPRLGEPDKPLPGAETKPKPYCMVVGASKLARLVECFARRLQLQERLGNQVADAIMDHLGAQGALVIIAAEHQCMTCRGVKKPGARFVTSSLRGVFDKNPTARAEAMQLLQLQGQ